MAELKHGSHECVLICPEIVSDGICNMCYKDELVEFACNSCNFDLCKTCSKIPQKVLHDFHPEHPLEFCVRKDDEKSVDMLCSGCGNLFTEPFYFKCKECEIYLDLSCGVLKNIATGWKADEMLHYSHAHLIRRCRPGLNVKGSCLLCELPLSPSAICYGCVQCHSFVHERCLDFPREFQHPVHPAHPLIRLDFTHTCGSGKFCDACRLPIDGAPFGCPECGFDLHMRCADSLLRGLTHKSHHHRLFYVATGAQGVSGEENTCQMCMTTIVISRDSFYHCVECDMKFHFECLGIPESVFKRSCHIHPLVCKVFLPEDDSMDYCGVCETVVLAGHHSYSCEECDFVGHIECILREKVPSPLYLKDLYPCGHDMTRPIDREENYETRDPENKILLNDISHNHMMTLGDIKDFYVVCYICDGDILGRPWECKTCIFMAHDYCIELRKPSRHRFHVNHLLTLLPSYPAGFIMNCDTCKTKIESFNLFCRVCNFIICTYCMVRAKQVLGELPRGQKFIGTTEGRCFRKMHDLVEVMVSRSYAMACTICLERLCGKVLTCVTCKDIYHPRCIELGRQVRYDHPLHPDHSLEMELTSGSKCIACKLSIKQYGYNCSICKVSFHIECMEAVSISTKIKSHEHYLYNFWMDDSRLDRACNICGASFYGCIDCKNFSAHGQCIGFPANVKNQQHQHVVVQIYSLFRMSCSLCGLDITSSEKNRYSCKHCKDVFHMECIMSMEEREAATEEEQIKDIYLMYIERDLFSLLKDVMMNSDDEDSNDQGSDF